MKLTLQDARNVIRTAFGRESFVASFISTLESDPTIPTACITAKGEMRYNPHFVEQYIKDRSDLFSLITHELLHPMFGHFVYNHANPLEALGADLVINATISIVFSDASHNGALFRNFYPNSGLTGLLRPSSRMHQSRYSGLYNSFYGMCRSKLSTGEVIQSLKVLTPVQSAAEVVLLGAHGGANGNTNGGMSQEIVSKIASDIQQAVKTHGGHKAGNYQNIFDLIIEVLRTHVGLKKLLLQRYLTKRKMDRFLSVNHLHCISTSPIPLQPSKRDLILLAADIPPLHYHRPFHKPIQQQRGLAIYLDVSGSVNQHLPKIVGLLQHLRNNLLTIYLFSNKVVQVPLSTLLSGQVHTTYGTDFDCIAESILEQGLDKAVVMTDGYATLEDKNQQELKRRNVRMLTLLFGGKGDCPEFQPFGDVLQLEDVVE